MGLALLFASVCLLLVKATRRYYKLPYLWRTTLAGNGKPGLADGDGSEAQFDEPTGLSYANGKLYVADTNNHAIRVVDVETGSVSTLELTGLSKLVHNSASPTVLEEQTVTSGTATIRVNVALPSHHQLNSATSSGVTLRAGETVLPAVLTGGGTEFSIDVVEAEMLRIDAVIYYCSEGRDNVCLYHAETLELPLRVGPDGLSEIALEIKPVGRS